MKPGGPQLPAVLVNGETTDCLSSSDRGLLYGDGVFETVAVERGRPRFWQRHMQRLQAGCRRLSIEGLDTALLSEETGLLLAGAQDCVLKVIVTRGRGGRGYAAQGCGPATRILQRHARPDYPASLQLDGVRVRLCRTRLSHNPRLAGIKHLNRLEQVLARSEWADTGTREGLMFDVHGHLAEGTMSNVFLVLDERLITPRLSDCGVAGVMRSVVLELAGALGLPVQVTSITADQLSRADELFLTSSLIGIWPVRAVETRDCRIGPVTKQLQDALSGLTTDGERWCCDSLQGDGDA